MPYADALPTIPCPNCQQPMQAQDLEHVYHWTVRVDLCFTCAGIWFDHLGSMQLAPASVIELFKEIQSHLNDARQPVAKQLGCPRCGDALTLGYDVCKSGQFSYFRCLRGDGRYTPFFQFLREKQFVRSLTELELERVRKEVRQVRCSECGAPIDLEHSSQCQYCHAPVSFLDPQAVEKAMRVWSDAANRHHIAPTPQALSSAMTSIQLPHADHPQSDPSQSPAAPAGAHLLAGINSLNSAGPGADLALDLVAIGINAIGHLFRNSR